VESELSCSSIFRVSFTSISLALMASTSPSMVTIGLVADTEDAAREVIQDVVETAAAHFQRDLTDVEQLIPVEMRLGLRLKAGVMTFVFERYFWELSIKQLLSVWCLFLLCVWFYQLLSWYSAPLGCRLDASRLDISIPKKELVSQPPGGSLN
jgi:hypothetical protein